ncbi:hypothetical protein [Intestinimonas massiliensis (ex Afouda et al. 2020)]|uniref:hypothetical protein n=1 Tax=Intestinimonas massiliensis (ex Afouda et al. 2020) TaxID=1673721 RepID=UPI00102F57F2|nr:hypothetical protein [Intestinimonas massiliensis (ex Afouda et al. 2020)]
MTELGRALARPVAGLVFDENRKEAVRRRACSAGGRRVRRALVALALCAALAVTAVAAGPSVWSALAEHLGPFGAWLTPLTGSSTSAGVELEVVGVLSDGTTARFYLTAHDTVGGRLDRHTSVKFDLEGAVSWGGSAVAFDGESDTLLLELEAINLTGEDLVLSGGTLTPNSYQVSVEPELADGLEVSQTYEELPGFSTSMGFDGENNFHLRIKLAEGYGLSARSAAFVTFSDGSAWSNQAEQVSYLSDGQDLRLAGITRENWDRVEKIWLVTGYTGPLEPIRGEWTLTLDPVAAEIRSTGEGFSLKHAGVTVTQVQLSPLGAVVTYTGEEDALTAEALRVETAAGKVPAWGSFSGWNWGGEGTAIWRYETPMEPEDVVTVTLLGETIPLTR